MSSSLHLLFVGTWFKINIHQKFGSFTVQFSFRKEIQKSDCNANIPIKEIKSAKLGQFAKLLSIMEYRAAWDDEGGKIL